VVRQLHRCHPMEGGGGGDMEARVVWALVCRPLTLEGRVEVGSRPGGKGGSWVARQGNGIAAYRTIEDNGG